ncbi:MAG TPA: helix-turn-helix domain-containing protein [Terriglobales bacterium]
MIDSSREAVTRTLSTFKSGHLVERNGATFIIRDRLALESMVPA